MDRNIALEDPEVVMMLTALINILWHDNLGYRPTEVLMMAAYGERGVLDRSNMRVMRWRNGALSGSDLANEPGLFQEVPGPTSQVRCLCQPGLGLV